MPSCETVGRAQSLKKWHTYYACILSHSSCVWLFCDPMDCSTPGLPVLHYLSKLAQTHVHWVSDAIQPSSPHLLLPQSFPASGSFPVNQLFTSDGQSLGALASASVLQWVFRVDFPSDWLVWSCCPQYFQESFPAPQFKAINSLAFAFLYGTALTTVHDYWEDHSLNYTDLCRQSNVSAVQDTVQVCHSFPAKKQSSSNFMAGITICSDFGAQEEEICHYFHLFPFCLP